MDLDVEATHRTWQTLTRPRIHTGEKKLLMQTPTGWRGPEYPTEPSPVPPTELGLMKCVYLADSRPHRDPTIIWGTASDAQPMTDFIAAESRRLNVLLSPAHLLIHAVAQSLTDHPHLNCRIVGRRVYPFRKINIAIPLLTPTDRQVFPVLIHDVARMSLRDIAEHLWNEARVRSADAASERRRDASRSPLLRSSLRIWRSLKMQVVLRGTSLSFAVNNHIRRPTNVINAQYNGVSALVNCLSFPGGAPPMLSFKPSSLPTNSILLTVTLGAPEWRATVVDRQVVARRMVPLFVKADHRIVHSHEIAAFMNTLCEYLTEPCRLKAAEPETAGVPDVTEFEAVCAPA